MAKKMGAFVNLDVEQLMKIRKLRKFKRFNLSGLFRKMLDDYFERYQIWQDMDSKNDSLTKEFDNHSSI